MHLRGLLQVFNLVDSDLRILAGENINEVPEGQSLFWQLFQRTNSTTRAPKIGLWAQISFKDSYDGASGSTTRDDQQSLFSVLIVIMIIETIPHDIQQATPIMP